MPQRCPTPAIVRRRPRVWPVRSATAMLRIVFLPPFRALPRQERNTQPRDGTLAEKQRHGDDCRDERHPENDRKRERETRKARNHACKRTERELRNEHERNRRTCNQQRRFDDADRQRYAVYVQGMHRYDAAGRNARKTACERRNDDAVAAEQKEPGRESQRPDASETGTCKDLRVRHAAAYADIVVQRAPTRVRAVIENRGRNAYRRADAEVAG